MDDKQQAAGMAPSFEYFLNDAGKPEFGSVIITIDHLSAPKAEDPHSHIKMVFSTQDELEALYANFSYYALLELKEFQANGGNLADYKPFASDPAIVKWAGGLFGADYPAYVYNTPVNTQIILAFDTFDRVIQDENLGGSVFLATESLVQIVQRQAAEKLGDAPAGSRVAPYGFNLMDMVQEDDEASADPDYVF